MFFYNEFCGQDFIISDEKAQEHLEKHYSVLIRYNDTSFIYPHMFYKLFRMEEKDNANYTKDIKEFFLFVKKNQNMSLHLFLTSFFMYLGKIQLKLTSLQIEVLKILTDKEFMYQNTDPSGEPTRNYRTYPPTYIEIHQALQQKGITCSARSVQKIKTDLFNKQICYDRRVMINFSKIGFIYIFVEDIPETPSNLRKYCLWQIQNGNKFDLVLCLPFGDIDNLLINLSYEILEEFSFNVDIDQYDKKNGLNNLKLPFNFLLNKNKNDEPFQGNLWDIRPLQKHDSEIDSIDIELLDSIIKSNNSNYFAIDRLTQRITKNHIDKRLQKLAKNGFFRFHSQVNYIGIDLSLRLKIRLKNDEHHLTNIKKFFSRLPEVMMFSKDNLIIVYIRIPRNTIDQLLENIYRFNIIFKNEKKNIFLYSNDFYSINNVIYVLDSIMYEKGIAWTKMTD